uniref:Interleukin-2 receptor subunit beta-like n=1 Tax=Astyanax mexicanus TaxID=7994 RepID=A0A3B1ISV4_ASTMX
MEETDRYWDFTADLNKAGHLLPLCKLRKRRMLVGQALLLVMMSLLTSSIGGQSLTCYNDYIETLTCEWNISALERSQNLSEDECYLEAICDDVDQVQSNQSDLHPMDSQPEIFMASIKFQNMCLAYTEHVSVTVQCGDRIVDKMDFEPINNVKLNPPEKLQVHGANVSWVPGSPHSKVITDIMYELQYKPLGQSWKEGKPFQDLQDSRCFLPEHYLILGRKYEVRVRSRPDFSEGSEESSESTKFWSDWSPPTKWTSTVGKPPPTPPPSDMLWLTPSLTGTVVVITVLILLVICRFHPVKCSMKYPDMHHPFGDLYNFHEGDFKSWVGTFVGPDSLLKASMEHISAVEVCKVTSVGVPIKIDESKRKSFSNSTYFLSQSSKCSVSDQLEPCSEHCPYGPAVGGSVDEKTPLAKEVSHNSDTENESSNSELLETSSSYKHLQKLRLDVQSPDSGFAAGSDQDSQEESGSEGLPSPPVVDKVLPISSVLPCPVPHISHMASFPHIPFFSTPGFGWSLENPDFQMLSSGISTNTFMLNPDFSDCCGMVEPASEDYMPVKNVQEG